MVTNPAFPRHVRVLAFTKYCRLAASSRHRFLDYIPLLAERNVSVTPVPLLSDAYIERLYAGRSPDFFDLARSFFRRVGAAASAHTFDLLWIEGELFPRFPALGERLFSVLKLPYVVDVDDAIFHRYDRHPHIFFNKFLRNKVDVVFANAVAVTAGNDYLAARARGAGAQRVVVVPTTVDHRAYATVERPERKNVTFGWIGSPGTAHYLKTIGADLHELNRSLPSTTRLIGIGADDSPVPKAICRPWTEESEVQELAQCDVGLAPLFDGPWERGKCALKAVQYMASGMPVLAADVGAAPNVIAHGETGFLYRDNAEFVGYARQLAADSELRRKMGAAGRRRVADHFSIHGWVDTLRDVLVSTARHAETSQISPRR